MFCHGSGSGRLAYCTVLYCMVVYGGVGGCMRLVMV